MTESEENSLYEKSLKKWGFDFQLDMVVEECAELIKAVQKSKRKSNSETFQERMESIVEEAVDVDLMIEQLKLMIPVRDFWERMKARKIRRLKAMLNEEEVEAVG